MEPGMVKIDIEKQAIETFVYNELRRQASYLSGGEVQRLSAILAERFTAEWLRQTEEIVRRYERLLTGGF